MTASVAGILIFSFVLLSCNNPFQTRDPAEPPEGGGVAIKPANSPENVLDNMKMAFNSYSIQDYADTFGEDFVFVPDTEDSLQYENDFLTTWNKERETDYATNLFTYIRSDSLVARSIEISLSSFEYKPGPDYYEYKYVLVFNDEVDEVKSSVTYRGRAWIYLKEYPDGKWYIYLWVDQRVQLETDTWGILRRTYI